MTSKTLTPFPIPVISEIGPGQFQDDGLDYLSMPQGMDVYRAPILPEPEEVAQCKQTLEVLARVERALQARKSEVGAYDTTAESGSDMRIDLQGLPEKDLEVLNQIMGEGEVAATVEPLPSDVDGLVIRVQESVFAGVWRVMECDRGDAQGMAGAVLRDYLEVAALPQALLQAARADWEMGQSTRTEINNPAKFANVSTLLTEIFDQSKKRVAKDKVSSSSSSSAAEGSAAHIINLSLLPVNADDISLLDYHLGTGRVVILSRGYGNCRIVNSVTPMTWRVVYYNSQDTVILNTVEIVAVPDVACAMREDMEDSHERIAEVLSWLQQN